MVWYFGLVFLSNCTTIRFSWRALAPWSWNAASYFYLETRTWKFKQKSRSAMSYKTRQSVISLTGILLALDGHFWCSKKRILLCINCDCTYCASIQRRTASKPVRGEHWWICYVNYYTEFWRENPLQHMHVCLFCMGKWHVYNYFFTFHLSKWRTDCIARCLALLWLHE